MKLYLFESDKIRDQKNNIKNGNIIPDTDKSKKEMGIVGKISAIIIFLLLTAYYIYGFVAKEIELSLGLFILIIIMFGFYFYLSWMQSIKKNTKLSHVLKKEVFGLLVITSEILVFVQMWLSVIWLFFICGLSIFFWFLLFGTIEDAIRKKLWKMLYPPIFMLFIIPISIYSLIALKNYPIIPINQAEVNALKNFSTYQIAYSRLMLKESGGRKRYLRITNLDKTSDTDNFKNLPDTVKLFFNETHSDINYNSDLSGFQVHMFPDRKLPLKPFNKIFKLPSFFVNDQGTIFIEWVSDRKKRNPAKQKLYHKISESEIEIMEIIIKDKNKELEIGEKK